MRPRGTSGEYSRMNTSRTPADAAAAVLQNPTLPPGDDERFVGFADFLILESGDHGDHYRLRDTKLARSVKVEALLSRFAKRPVEMHVLARGGHGFNMGNRSRLASVKTWPQRMADWMGDNYILDPSQRAEDERRAKEAVTTHHLYRKAAGIAEHLNKVPVPKILRSESIGG